MRADLKLCPDEDPHACALYFYTEAGGHMGYHYDTSYYRGARYTVLVGPGPGLVQPALCRLRTRQPGRAPIDLAVATDARRHGDLQRRQGLPRGSPSQAGSGGWCNDGIRHQPGDGAPAARFSNLKDAFTYFGIRALLRGRAGARVPSRP